MVTHSRGLRRLLLALTAGAAATTLLAGCVTQTSGTPHANSAATSAPSGSAATTPPTVAPISFSDCSNSFNLSGAIPADRRSKLTVECGKVRVPQNYDHPNGDQLSVSVIKLHYTEQTQRIGSLLMNPGGPGGSGIFLAISEAGSIDISILQHFDLVGFDPRGVGVSSPVSCISDAQKDTLNGQNPNVLTTAGFAQAKASAGAVAAACTSKYGTELADYNTIETARDMDAIRAGVGDEKMNYLGYSYGTQLGSIYAHLFPTRIRVAVLDGAVNPDTDAITSFANQLQGFEAAFDQFAADCITKSPCKSLGNPRQVVYDLVKQANITPLRSSKSGETRTAGSAIVLTGVLSALYSSDSWPTLGNALIQAQQGDAAGLFELADEYNERSDDGTYSNIYEANLTISCNDEAPGPTDAVIRTTAAQWATKYPMFGLWSASALFGCQAWQPVRHLLPSPSAAGSKPILVIGTLHDPATPYASTKALASALGPGVGVVLSWDGQGHTAYGRGSDCIDTKVNDYLINGTLPPPGTVCPA
ncbi:alpha/beta hydrolase fold [Frankineae bacterium MT45]|nr:alpha/beta hydrolase fold [Frankineae bacterium MT45]